MGIWGKQNILSSSFVFAVIALLPSPYTNARFAVLTEIDLSLFYEDFIVPNTSINEIPVDKLNILIDQMGIIIENSKEEKPFSFDLYLVLDFIDKVSQELLQELKK